jgi:hypothetical protein
MFGSGLWRTRTHFYCNLAPSWLFEHTTILVLGGARIPRVGKWRRRAAARLEASGVRQSHPPGNGKGVTESEIN